MKEPILGETTFEDFIEKLRGIKKRLRCQVHIHLLRLSLWRTEPSKNTGYIKMIVGNGPENQGSRRPEATSRLTSQERLRKPEDHLGP